MREIASHLLGLYGVEVSADLISTVTDAVLDEITTWQARPLEPVYPLVVFDALRVKIRDEGLVCNRAVHIAFGVPADGTKEILGLLLGQNEGAKFRLRVMPPRQASFAGTPDEPIEDPRRQGCPTGCGRRAEGLSRGDPAGVSRGHGADLQRASAAPQPGLRLLEGPQASGRGLEGHHRAVGAAAAEAALLAFDAGPWGRKYAAIGQSWRRAWGEVVPFYAFHVDVRRLLYTTNSIEALNAKLRRAVRARGHFPTDEAALKLLLLVLNKAEKEWTMPPREWSMVKPRFAVLFGERFTRPMA